MKKILLFMIGLAMAGKELNAQDDSRQKAWQALRSLSQVYQQPKMLSFDILYTYSKEDKPGQPLDSLYGQYKLDGTKYWSMMDQTEAAFDNTLLVMLFKEDNIMYLARPTAIQATANPVSMLDSFMAKNPNAGFAYNESREEKVIELTMANGGPYKKVTYHISKKTGYLNRMTSLVRSDQLYDASVRNLVAGAATVYAVVETFYTNYKQGTFDETVFNLGRYFKKEGEEYITVAPYSSYKVFLGSTGM